MKIKKIRIKYLFSLLSAVACLYFSVAASNAMHAFAETPVLTQEQRTSLIQAANNLKLAVLEENLDQIMLLIDQEGFPTPEGDEVVSYNTIIQSLKNKKGGYYCHLFGGCVHKHKQIPVIEIFRKYKDKGLSPEISILDRASSENKIEASVTFGWTGRDQQKNYDVPQTSWVFKPGIGWRLTSLFE